MFWLLLKAIFGPNIQHIQKYSGEVIHLLNYHYGQTIEESEDRMGLEESPIFFLKLIFSKFFCTKSRMRLVISQTTLMTMS
jgi:hypothetical protein